METRPRPIDNAVDHPVLDGVQVQVIQASFQILLVPAGVLEESPLPDPLFIPGAAACVDCPRRTAIGQPLPCKQGFDSPPSRGVVIITSGHLPDGMQMVWQKHDCGQSKRTVRHHLENRFSEDLPAKVSRQDWSPLMGHHREKVRAAFPGTSIVAHLVIIGFVQPQHNAQPFNTFHAQSGASRRTLPGLLGVPSFSNIQKDVILWNTTMNDKAASTPRLPLLECSHGIHQGHDTTTAASSENLNRTWSLEMTSESVGIYVPRMNEKYISLAICARKRPVYTTLG